MNIQIEKQDSTVTLALEGRLDTTTAPQLEATIGQEAADATALVLDMAQLTYISSAGLRVLLGAQKRMNTQGTMELTHVCEAVLEVLEMTGFADILTIV